jgi:hypothetical protein
MFTAVEVTTKAIYVFSKKEKDPIRAEEAVLSYLRTNLPEKVFSVQLQYVIPDINTVHLLAIQ